jgi:RNA recognition motif-containing protein
MSAAVADSPAIMDFTATFARWRAEDPILNALWEGTMKWGDIPGICDDKPRTRAESVSSDESEPDILTICSHSRRVKFADKPAVKHFSKEDAIAERVVPAYTPGIKTVITRNLPRDITVDALRGVFEKYGPIRDIYIPRNMDKSSPYFGTIKGFALIKFLKPTDSARAYESEYGRLTMGKNNITVEFAKEDR